jgi:hypothetical protein
MKRQYQHVNYRTGIATEVTLPDLNCWLVARTTDDLRAAFTRITEGKAHFNSDLAQSVKISRVRQKQQPTQPR